MHSNKEDQEVNLNFMKPKGEYFFMKNDGKKKKTGTLEWAKKNINISDGCSHNCRYCYARQMKVDRYKQVSPENWDHETISQKKVDKNYRRVYNGDPSVYDVMFPTTHDITPAILEPCVRVLRRLLSVGNRVVIVSKPHMECIEALTVELKQWKPQILFRFTITALDDDLLRYWERNAPSLGERLSALKCCYDRGYETSVSIEPCLDLPNVPELVSTVSPFVKEKIWIGTMRGVRSRVRIDTEEDKAMVENLISGQSKENVLEIYDRLQGNEKVLWKDSIIRIVETEKLRPNKIKTAEMPTRAAEVNK
jgi:DNA repair photolyase